MGASFPSLSDRWLRELYLADLGEMAGPLAHEVNNLLNNLTLHLALWQQKTPEAGSDVESLQRQMRHVAAQVARFQRQRNAGFREKPGTELAGCVQRAAEAVTRLPPAALAGMRVSVIPLGDAVAEDGVGVALELAPELPTIKAPASDVERLCRLLLVNAVRAAANGDRRVRLGAESGGAGVQLAVEDSGPDVPVAMLGQLFEPGHECREGMCCLQLAACRSLVRRLEGRLEAKARPGGGLMILVELPAIM